MMDDELLIELVRENPVLYDSAHFKYSDITHKADLWKRIGELLRSDAGKCKQRWESLRSQYRKFMRNTKSKTYDGQQPKWKYSDQLSFIHPHMKDKKTNADGSEDNQDDMDDPLHAESNDSWPETNIGLEISTPSSSSTQKRILTFDELPEDSYGVWKSLAKKRKSALAEMASTTHVKHVLDVKKDTRFDELDLFFDTMKMTVKKFTISDKLLVKRKVFNIITEIEEMYADDEQL
ncbi:BESS motif,MADF domain [Cinara cedri]|uniref:BESS motif,MADF domain n=1 Tax=Cinara cedri TaxID=506608 RepID=A0A5E4NQU2_9HEMI|nr:BESS motif,MADF domain [Cinara cedri]